MTVENMTFKEFEDAAVPVKRENYDELGPLGLTLFWSNGLGGEAGEVQNAIKKIVRDGINESHIEDVLEECGDVLFYMKQLLERYGLTVEDAAAYCMVKLYKMRQEKDNA